MATNISEKPDVPIFSIEATGFGRIWKGYIQRVVE
jgi:hypothetical protein